MAKNDSARAWQDLLARIIDDELTLYLQGVQSRELMRERLVSLVEFVILAPGSPVNKEPGERHPTREEIQGFAADMGLWLTPAERPVNQEPVTRKGKRSADEMFGPDRPTPV